jgi:glutaredoxin
MNDDDKADKADKVNSVANKIITKITNNKDIYLIFGRDTCGFCKRTLEILTKKNLQFKFYEVDKYYEIFIQILHKIHVLSPQLNIDLNHDTFPVIFYNEKFIGGFNNLKQILG